MAGTYASVVALFTAGALTDASPLDRVKGIGPMMFERLQRHHVATPADLVAVMSDLSSAEVHAALSYFTLNARANQCVAAGGPRVHAFVALNGAPPATPVRYHVQDSNCNGYNALLNVLRYARTHPPGAFRFDYDIGALPPYQQPRSDESAYCGCQATRNACGLFATSCEWKTGDVGGGRRGRPVVRGLCVPRGRATGGFRGRNGFRGQRNEPAKPSGGPLFVHGWRVPGPSLDPLAYPIVDYAEGDNADNDDGEEEEEEEDKGGGGGGGGGDGGRGGGGGGRGGGGGGGGGPGEGGAGPGGGDEKRGGGGGAGPGGGSAGAHREEDEQGGDDGETQLGRGGGGGGADDGGSTSRYSSNRGRRGQSARDSGGRARSRAGASAQHKKRSTRATRSSGAIAHGDDDDDDRVRARDGSGSRRRAESKGGAESKGDDEKTADALQHASLGAGQETYPSRAPAARLASATNVPATDAETRARPRSGRYATRSRAR